LSDGARPAEPCRTPLSPTRNSDINFIALAMNAYLVPVDGESPVGNLEGNLTTAIVAVVSVGNLHAESAVVMPGLGVE